MIKFIKVNDARTKQFKIVSIVTQLYLQGRKILILTPNEEVALYIDNLLWRTPADSFLPHTVANDPSEERIVIACKHENLNNATVIFNLTTEISPFLSNIEVVFELYDETSSERLSTSQKKMHTYSSKQLTFSEE